MEVSRRPRQPLSNKDNVLAGGSYADLVSKVNNQNRPMLKAFIDYMTIANRYTIVKQMWCYSTNSCIEQVITKEKQEECLSTIIPDITPAECAQIISLCKHKNYDFVVKYTNSAKSLLTEMKFDSSNLDDLKMIKNLIEKRSAMGNNNMHPFIYLLLFTFAKEAENLALDEAELKDMDIANLSLISSTLTKANISKTKFNGGGFENINLENAYLNDVTMNRCKLKHVSMENALFNGDINLEDIAVFDHVNMLGVNAFKATVNMRGLVIKNSDFSETKWNNADFSNSESYNTTFKYANLERSNLDNIKWDNVDLVGTQLGSVSLKNATISLAFPQQITASKLDIWFNHLNQRNEGSILTAIESIDNKKYNKLKLGLMHQVINWFNKHNVDISTIIGSLEQILYNNELYTADVAIGSFIVEKMLPLKLINSSSKVLNLSYLEINYFYDHIANLSEEDKSSFVEKHSSLINQLIYYAQNEYYSKYFATKIKEIYLSSKPIQEILQVQSAKYLLGVKDLSDLASVQNFIFFAKVANKPQLLIVSEDYIAKFLYYKNVSSPVEWTHLIHIKDNTVQKIVDINLSSLFKTFTVFNASYLFAQNKAKFCHFLKLLNLGYYYYNFEKATEAKRYNEQKLIDEEAQKILNSKFKEFLVQSKDDENDGSDNIASAVKLTDNHFNLIITKLELKHKPEKDQAAYFLCLAAVFATYSSSSFFGEGDNSPEALRYYGLALLNKALELYSEVAGDQSISWQNKFLGRLNEHPCTALLSAGIIQYCLTNFPDTAAEIIPTSWH